MKKKVWRVSAKAEYYPSTVFTVHAPFDRDAEFSAKLAYMEEYPGAKDPCVSVLYEEMDDDGNDRDDA